jgi:hypothetical protein
MNNSDRIKASHEFVKVMAEYPQVAKIVLSQQAILQEVAQSGVRLVQDRICRLLDLGVPVLFEDYWRQRCQQNPPELPPLLQCIATARNPQDCFRLENDEWFDDPFADSRRFPQKPPIPPLQPR